jgi:hypothetical protein
MNIIEEIEERLLPGLRKVAQQITEQFPRVKATVWSSPVGSETEFQGYDIGIDCLLTDAKLDQSDNIALVIGIRHLSTTPLIDADVCWGHPSGWVEAELFPDPLEVTPEILQEVETRLPVLYEGLRRAVIRGHPPDET